jgi:hypothetical protein
MTWAATNASNSRGGGRRLSKILSVMNALLVSATMDYGIILHNELEHRRHLSAGGIR